GRGASSDKTWTLRGSLAGRSFAANTRSTASRLSASAPSPYTVSVGNTTSPPRRRHAAAVAISAASGSRASTLSTSVTSCGILASMQLALPFVSAAPIAPPPSYIRNLRARRYVLRVDADGAVRVTIPRGGSRRAAEEFAGRHVEWIAK